MRLLATILMVFLSTTVFAADEKIYMSCSGSYTIDEHFFDNKTESILITITGPRPKNITQWGKRFGTLKFSKSSVPSLYYETLRICGEDELKFVLEPICHFDNESWPSNVLSMDRNCTLDKVTGKFFCSLNIIYKGKEPASFYRWDYDCKVVKSPELK